MLDLNYHASLGYEFDLLLQTADAHGIAVEFSMRKGGHFRFVLEATGEVIQTYDCSHSSANAQVISSALARLRWAIAKRDPD